MCWYCEALEAILKDLEPTLPETNVAPENNQWLENYFAFGTTYFQVVCLF